MAPNFRGSTQFLREVESRRRLPAESFVATEALRPKPPLPFPLGPGSPRRSPRCATLGSSPAAMPELRQVRTRGQVDSDFTITIRLDIVLGQALAYLACAGPNGVILIGVVVGFAAEDFDTDRSLLQRTAIPIEGFFRPRTLIAQGDACCLTGDAPEFVLVDCGSQADHLHSRGNSPWSWYGALRRSCASPNGRQVYQ